MAAAFIEDHVSKLRSAHEVERVIRYDLQPEFGDWPIDEISRGHIRDWLRQKAKASPVMANRCLAHLRKLLNWAVDEELIDTNPAARIKAPAPEAHRERVLSDDELRAVWIAADRMGFPGGVLVRLLVLTCQRLDEVAGMMWPELSLDNATWRVPQERSKSGSGHVVPLSKPAVRLLSDLPRFDGFAHVFVSGRVGDKPVSGHSKMKRRLDALSGVRDWRLHDLRRTGATGMRSLGVDRLTVSKVLNHAEQGVTAVYDRYSEDKEKRQALERWGAHVLRLAADQKAGKVVPLRAGS